MFDGHLKARPIMRKPRLSILAPLIALAALPIGAAANCYSVYDGQNLLVFQSTVSPIDLSGRISQTMRERFPGTFMVMLPDDSDCREMRTGPVVTRFTPSVPGAVRSPDEVLTASPLVGGTGTAGPTSSEGSSATRGGNNLNVRRKP
jgi:hypothetical protein